MIDSRFTPTSDVVAPPSYSAPGRPQWRRSQSAGETGPSKAYRCRSCGENVRHNKRTCRNHGRADYAPSRSLSGTAIPVGGTATASTESTTNVTPQPTYISTGLQTDTEEAEGGAVVNDDASSENPVTIPSSIAMLLN